VLGLGGVYFGASVARRSIPRHRLVTAKCNPARVWTPENAVGIGGACLGIDGMEGPGGYWFVTTVQVWSSTGCGPAFEPGSPWLLRFFDCMRWDPTTAEELLELRADMPAERPGFASEDGSFERTAWTQAGELARR
jgi:urea carboxylase